MRLGQLRTLGAKYLATRGTRPPSSIHRDRLSGIRCAVAHGALSLSDYFAMTRATETLAESVRVGPTEMKKKENATPLQFSLPLPPPLSLSLSQGGRTVRL